MMKFLVLNFLMFTTVLAQAGGLSAVRLPTEDFQSARERSYIQKFETQPESLFQPLYTRRDTAEGRKKVVTEVAADQVPELPLSVISDLFVYLRDTKFLRSKTYERRATWLFPDDGCYARAGIMNLNIAPITDVKPAKIFVFGNLMVETKNTPSGFVTWWYHVAIAYRDGESVYVLDPSINPYEPTPMSAWLSAMSTNPDQLKVSFCHSEAYDPDSHCTDPREMNPSEIYREQNMFLPQEWNRLIDLGRDPKQELGDYPPWKQAL